LSGRPTFTTWTGRQYRRRKGDQRDLAGPHERVRHRLGPALVGLVRRFGALVRDAGDDEFAGLETTFAGHGGQFVTQ
jgi:hypothetical protein